MMLCLKITYSFYHEKYSTENNELYDTKKQLS